METIIVKTGNAKKTKAVLDFLKKNRIRAEVYPDQSKEQVLNSIEKGAKEAAAHIKGKTKLRHVKELLDEL